MSFAKLEALAKKLDALAHAQSMLGVDEAVQMPSGGGEKRAEAMSMIAGMSHDMASAPYIADWIEAASREPLDDMQQAALREFRRVYINLTCLSSDFVRRQVETCIRAQQLWRALKATDDWQGFLPSFEAIVTLAREESQLRASVLKLSPYDALIEQFDPGSRAADVTPVFTELKSFLKDFIPKALARQEQKHAVNPARNFNAPFPVERQKALGEAMMKAIGFDFNHGRLDVSHHPFCGGVPSDVRMTTRYTTSEFLSSLMGILHETGHGLYEQGLPRKWSHWAVGSSRGMAAHESQSLFVEMQVARNPAFWEWAMPVVREHLGEDAVAGWAKEDVLAHVHKIEKGYIRVNADEATYPLHIILRFEIEQMLIEGNLPPRDVPEVWDAKMREYLGLSTIDKPADGPLQDVHWPSGAFGYFPSYTLGAMMAAQQWAAIARENPGINAEVAQGNFTTLNDWRRKNIWQKASTLSTPELMRKATGETLQARYFTNHLQDRYLA